MTTYSAEVNIYNPEAIADAVDEAGTANTMVTAIGSTGVQVHPAGQNPVVDYTQIDSSGVKLYKGGVQVASFGDTATIGKNAGPHTVIQSGGVDFYGASDGSVNLAHIGYGEGAAASGTAVAPYYTFGIRFVDAAVGNYSIAEGINVDASGYVSHAEGLRTKATYPFSHAEGGDTEASAEYTHAEGYHAKAIGTVSHAEGSYTEARGLHSHAEGSSTIASGGHAHAQNYETVASKLSQTALGTFNIEDTSATTTHPSGAVQYGKYAVIVGNGTADNARSNAAAITWDGALEVANKPQTRTNLGIAAGSAGGSQIAANSYGDITIDLSGYGFTAAPTVTATLYNTGASTTLGSAEAIINSVSATQAVVRVFNSRASTLTPNIRWIAVGN